jgi:hypothetical protein
MVAQLRSKFFVFYGSRRFVTVFTRACHWTLSWVSSAQCTLYLRYILILLSHLHLDFPRHHFLSGFPTKILYEFLISPTRATCPTHLIVLDLNILMIFGEKYKLDDSHCVIYSMFLSLPVFWVQIFFLGTLLKHCIYVPPLGKEIRVSNPYKIT